MDAVRTDSSCAWFNVYSRFTSKRIWPRGFTLEFLQERSSRYRDTAAQSSRSLILQGLANGNPDVDAVYRLTQELPLDFFSGRPVLLDAGVWCPFNSQNTIFRQDAFPLLYLPSKCSFRMTDIWRSLVAQHCLWEMEEGVVFHSVTVYQERNEHDLLPDFADEVPGYLLNDRIRRALEDCNLDKQDLAGSLSKCYESRVKYELFPNTELPVVAAWCAEVERAVH